VEAAANILKTAIKTFKWQQFMYSRSKGGISGGKNAPNCESPFAAQGSKKK
jgi:hypothetical protein